MVDNNHVLDNRKAIYDVGAILKASGTVATTNMVGESPLGTDIYFDTGGGFTRGNMVIRIATMPNILASTKFILRLQGGMNTGFTTICDLNITELGDATQISATTDKGVAGNVLVVPFSNMFADTVYRYLRHEFDFSGTIGTGMAYEVYLSSLN